MKKKGLIRFTSRLMAGIMICSMFFGAQCLEVSAKEGSALDIGSPSFKRTETLTYYNHDVEYTPDNMLKKIHDADIAAGGDSFYMDRVLGRDGVANGNSSNNGNDDANTFLTRGRALYMKTSNPRIIGFGGDTSYHQPLGKDMYSITFKDGTTALNSTEITNSRVNAPSNWSSVYTLDSGLKINVSKFISYENVAVTLLNIENSGDVARQITMNVNSGFVNEKSTVMINGQEQKELIGTFSSPFNLTTITGRLTGDDLDYGSTNSVLTRTIDIPAGDSTEVKVAMTFSTVEIPKSYEDYICFAEYNNSEALRAQKAEYNEWWNENIPYIDIPNKAVQKAIDYRWWSERFNSLDANIPGYDYQYPVTIEGVLGYNNAIILTQPMHLQDTKWMRSAYLPYGQLLSAGNSSQSSAFLDNPGNRSNWNNHYGQYLATAGYEAFNVIGGNADLAEAFAYYFEHDAKGQLDHYGNHDDLTLIAYRNNYMTGNDADTISMHYGGGGTWKMHAENAYVYGAANASQKLYQLIGNTVKEDELSALANTIQTDILENLWCNQCEAFETRAVAPSGSFVVHNHEQPKLIPLKESNNFNYFSEYVVPTDTESVAKYGKALEYLKYADEFPLFPYYTANQVDNKILPGSNNFSNINFTVQARAYEAALRAYDPTHEYVTPKMLSTMVEWCAWNIFPDAGDVRYPNNNEFFNFDGKTYENYYRSWIHHNTLGNYNYIFVEDMAGLRPRSDDKIELWPIDFDYDYFMVNNLKYHGKDVTIVWDKVDGNKQYGEAIPEGYSLYLDGELVLNLDDLARVTYDPNTAEVTFPDPANTANVVLKKASSFPAALDVELDETRVVDMIKKSGIDLTIDGKENFAKGATVTASYTPSKARAATWAEKHRADGNDPTSKAVNETKPDPNAVVDGFTVNMPFWGNDKSINESDWLEIDIGESKKIDMLNVYFYNDRQNGGYAEPAKYNIQYWDSTSESWKHTQNQTRTPSVIAANYNNNKFEAISTNKVRLTFFNKPGKFTAVTEVQLFNEGGERQVVVNEAPVVSIKVDENKKENMKAYLVAECFDDGLPYDSSLTFTWEVTDKPDDSIVFITGEKSLNPTIAASLPGDYTVKFTANDGELSSEASIVITISESSNSAERDIAVLAEPSSDYTAGWENIAKVNDPANEPTRSSAGTGNGWGNWGVDGGAGSTHYIQYSWGDVVSINKNEIYWYDDNGGTRIPRSISFEYQDKDGNWHDANMVTNFADAKAVNQYNTIELEPIFAKALRMKCVMAAAGTGVLRWKVYSPPVGELLPIFKATKTGVVPELPEYIYAKLKDGSLTKASVVWDIISPEDVSSSSIFKVSGINMDTGKFATADVYVRDDMDVATITDVFNTEVITEIGNIGVLPETVKVQYNNGAIDSVSVPVEWDLEAIGEISTVGDHIFTGVGTVEGTATKANLVLTVVGEKPTVIKTELKAKIDESKKYLESNYTEESWEKFATAKSDANAVYENPDATQEQVDDVLDALIVAVAALEIKSDDDDREPELVLHLAFDGNVDDSSSNGYSGELSGTGDTETIWVEGIDGQAINFEGENTWLEIPAENNLLSPDITLAYWIKRTGTLTGNNSILWAKEDSKWNGNGFYTNYPVGQNYSSFFVMDGFNGFYVDEDPNEFLSQDEWTHIAVTWNSIKKEGSIYKNGILQPISLLGEPESISAPESGTVANRFGKNGYADDPQYPAGLQLDDFRIYNGVLDQEAIDALVDKESGHEDEAKYLINTEFNMDSLKPNELIEASVEVTNKTNMDDSVMVIVALYNEKNQMKNFAYISKKIRFGMRENMKAGFRLPGDVGGYKVKAFVWSGNSLEASNLEPLSEVVEIRK